VTTRIGPALLEHTGAISLIGKDRDNRGDDRRQRLGRQDRLRRLKLWNLRYGHRIRPPGWQRAADTRTPDPLGFRSRRAIATSAAATATARARNRQIHKA
jgi:hypothetical protein